MRINVYAEELTPEVVSVERTTETGMKLYGIRIFLASSKKLRHSVDIDDRSAITFWVRRTPKRGTDVGMLQKIAMSILGKLTLVEEAGQNENSDG